MPNAIEQLVGQLIIAGFRGKTADQTTEIAKYIIDYNNNLKFFMFRL